MRLQRKILPLALTCATAAMLGSSAYAAGIKEISSTLQPEAAIPAIQQPKVWLIDHLPAATNTYLSIPPLWSLLMLNGNDQPPALAKALSDVRPDVLALLLKDVPEAAQPLVSTLINEVSAPIEVAIADAAQRQPQFYLSTTLNNHNAAQIDEMIASAATTDGGIKVHIDKPGEGSISKHGRTILAYRFNADSGQLLIMGHNAPTDADWQWTQSDTDNALKAELIQLRGDTRDLFIWQKSIPMLTYMLASKHPLAAALDLQNLRSISITTDSRQNHYTAQMALSMPDGGLRSLFPISAKPITLNTQGQPEWLVMTTLPDAEQIDAIAANLKKYDKTSGDYQSFKQKLKTEQGIDLDQLINAFAGRWLLFADDNGELAAVDKSREQAVNDGIDMLKTAGWITGDQDLGNGIRHLSIHNKLTDDLDGTQHKQNTPAILQAIISSPKDLYLKQEGDYLLFAKLPQPLMARGQSTPSISTNEWMSKAGIDSSTSNFAFVLPVQNLSTKHYNGMLEYLQFLGNATGHPVNLTKLPTAQSLKMAKSDLLSMNITNSGDALVLKLHSPNDLSDWMYAGNSSLTMIAGAGIVAAIAIPAYQDYVMRSEATGVYRAVDDALKSARSADEHQRIEQAVRQNRLIEDVRFEGDTVKLRLGGSFDGAWMTIGLHQQGNEGNLPCSFDNTRYQRYLPTACR